MSIVKNLKDFDLTNINFSKIKRTKTGKRVNINNNGNKLFIQTPKIYTPFEASVP